jgi:hypothetical protein
MPKERPLIIKALRVSLLICSISFLYYGFVILIHPWIQCSSSCYASRSAQLYFNSGTIIIGLVVHGYRIAGPAGSGEAAAPPRPRSFVAITPPASQPSGRVTYQNGIAGDGSG